MSCTRSFSRTPPGIPGGRSIAYAVALCRTVCAVLAGEPGPALPPYTPPADAPAPDKSEFTLWNPTPVQHLREMNALYDSPWTVDAGHLQLETYAVSYAHNRSIQWGADTTSDLWSAGSFTLKAGVLNNLDAEVSWTPYSWVRQRDNNTGLTTRQQGFGDVIARFMLNLWGNDGGSTALAVLPFVKLPTNQDELGNHHVVRRVGVSDEADDVNPYLGVSFRF